MLTLRKQSAEVRELSAEASLAARRMHHAANAGKRSLVEAATRPAGLVAGALVIGAAVWLWPRGGARAGSARAILRYASTAVHVGTLAWRFTRPFLPANAAPAPGHGSSRRPDARTAPRPARAAPGPSARSQPG